MRDRRNARTCGVIVWTGTGKCLFLGSDLDGNGKRQLLGKGLGSSGDFDS